jgi:Pyruvate/2-oxoacid:ferredoxin oxidoreductase gamma subunit
MVAMGVYLQVAPDLSVDLVREALIEEMEKRGRESLVEENLKAIQAGSEWYMSEEKKQRETR